MAKPAGSFKAFSLRSSLVTLALAAAPLACSDGSPAGSAAGQTGSVGLSLSTHGVSIASVSYVITGPGAYTKSGSIDVSHSTTINTVISAIPAGSGYSITLSATPTSGASSCNGTAPFTVVAQQTTPVSVELLCHESATTGSVLVNGTLNVCAQLNDLSAAPTTVAVGGTVSLSASASDSDGPGPISYQWTTTGGTLTGANAMTASLVCTAAGSVTVSVVVSDGDPACSETSSVVIACGAQTGAGGAGGMGAGGMTAAGGMGAGGSNASGNGGTSGASASGAGGAGTSGSAGTGGSAGAGAGAGGQATGGNGAGGAAAGAGGAAAGAGGAGAGGVSAGGSGGGAGGASAGASGAAAGGTGGTGGGRDIVVYRVGDGAGSLVNTGNPIFIDEYTVAGSPVKSTLVPTTASGSNHPLVASGTATSEGLISLSQDGHFVLLTGYNSTLPASSSLSGTSSTAVPRGVGRLDAHGNLDTSTSLTDFATGNNPRSVASTDGSNLWIGGGAGGVRFTTFGATTSTQLSTTVANIRGTSIFASQLYVSDSSGSAVRLGTVGTGLPTTASQTITNLTGFPLGGSPYAFFFADLDGNPGVDTLYVTDDGIGLTKYALIGSTWTAEGTVGTSSDAYRGLTGVVSGTNVTLFAVRKGGSGATGGGELVSLVDGGGMLGTLSGTPVLLATAAANEAFRGVALAPLP